MARNRGTAKLRLSMLGTLALVIGSSTLFFVVILNLMGSFNIFTLGIFIVGFNVLQWLIAPYLIDAMYGVKDLQESAYPSLYLMVRRISQRTGLSMPKLKLASMPIPNAFAYGSPIAGSRVAVTEGLLETLEEEEVEAVLGHELGHLKHRDVQIVMFLSVLPAIFYFLGYSLLWSSWLGGRDRRNTGLAILIGFAAMAFYWILNLLILGASRLREYYADQHSVQYVPDGARKLSEGLAKIVHYTRKSSGHQQGGAHHQNAFKALFIADPDTAQQDSMALHRTMSGTDQALVQALLSRKVTTADKIMELFTTHPNIVKRLRALEPYQGGH